MNRSTRRTFLMRGSLGVALAGALAAVPGLATVFKLSPLVARAQASTASGSMAGPLIAHVRDVNSGEISILYGTRRVIRRDADLAARLHAAAQER